MKVKYDWFNIGYEEKKKFIKHFSENSYYKLKNGNIVSLRYATKVSKFFGKSITNIFLNDNRKLEIIL